MTQKYIVFGYFFRLFAAKKIHQSMERESLAASVPAFLASLANAGKMPALLEAAAL
jgi:hypothetical protein